MTVDFNVNLIIYFDSSGTKYVHVYLVSDIIIMILLFMHITFKGITNPSSTLPFFLRVSSTSERAVCLYTLIVRIVRVISLQINLL